MCDTETDFIGIITCRTNGHHTFFLNKACLLSCYSIFSVEAFRLFKLNEAPSLNLQHC